MKLSVEREGIKSIKWRAAEESKLDGGGGMHPADHEYEMIKPLPHFPDDPPRWNSKTDDVNRCHLILYV